MEFNNEKEFMDKAASYNIPENLVGGLKRYIFDGIPTGHFLQAVLTNDLFSAMARADMKSSLALTDLTKFIYNTLPNESYGSKDKMDSWLAKGGLTSNNK